MEDFITTDMFTSLIGCVAIVTAGTQLLKQYIRLNPLIINFIMSLLVCVIRIFVINDLTPMGITMGLLNIIPIMLSSTGTYEVSKNIAEKVKGER